MSAFALERFTWDDGVFEVAGRWPDGAAPAGRVRLVVDVAGRRRRLAGTAAGSADAWSARFVHAARPVPVGTAELEAPGALVVALPPPDVRPEPAPEVRGAEELLQALRTERAQVEAAREELARERQAAEAAARRLAEERAGVEAGRHDVEREAVEAARRVAAEEAGRVGVEAGRRAATETAAETARREATDVAERVGRQEVFRTLSRTRRRPPPNWPPYAARRTHPAPEHDVPGDGRLRKPAYVAGLLIVIGIVAALLLVLLFG